MSENSIRDNEPKIDAQEIMEGIVEWVEAETPSHEPEALNKLADRFEVQYSEIGLEIERTKGEDNWGDLFRARTPGMGDEPGILVLSHFDTVHPIGTKEGDNAIRREGDKLYGPGIYDMKAGAHLAYYAYRHLVRLGKKPKLPVTFMQIPEEEVGSPYTRKYIEEEAKRAKYVLVTEPARDGGKVVTARKGVARFEMKAIGRPAHSGAMHQDGRSAIKEIAKQILDIEALTDYERGVTTNVGLITGGTGVNVVPRECAVEIDMRVVTAADGEEYSEKILNLKPYDPDVTLEISGGMNRPPYELRAENEALFEHARKVSAEFLDLQATKLTGGGSDGNFTAALGTPTLDGLGADGAGAHTLDEYVLISSFEPRARMWVRLFETLE